MKLQVHYALLLFLILGCGSQQDGKSIKAPTYKTDVGNILFDKSIDDSDFMLCDSTMVISGRNAIGYARGKTAFEKECKNKFNSTSDYQSFNGFVVVTFLVNCKNETDRYRAETIDWDFSAIESPKGLIDDLLEIVRGLNTWEHASNRNPDSDCSKFINFKIVNGKIENVLF